MSNWGDDQEPLPEENKNLSAMTLEPRKVKLTNRTGVEVLRTLPHRQLRTIGAWCFVDHFGPTSQPDAMSVAAHPHTGLQTASWLFDGIVEHRDSLGSHQLIRPGELNLMTAGSGIAHSELSVEGETDFHGVQLWIALPDSVRNQEPHFEHHENLPVVNLGANLIKVFAGKLAGAQSPAAIYTELVGAEISIVEDFELEINQNFEYGVLVVAGDIQVDGETVQVGSLRYLPAGQAKINFSGNGKVIFLGGIPFPEQLVMWWNFIGRSHEEIVQMRTDWNSRINGFIEFPDRIGGYIPAPEMPNLRLRARGNRI